MGISISLPSETPLLAALPIGDADRLAVVSAPGARGLLPGVAAAVADGAAVPDVDALAASLFETGALGGLFSLCQHFKI